MTANLRCFNFLYKTHINIFVPKHTIVYFDQGNNKPVFSAGKKSVMEETAKY